MDIDNASFNDLESFGEDRFCKIAVEKFWIFVR